MSPRLLHVVDDARQIGGAQIYLHGVAAGLAARGWESGLLARAMADGPFAWSSAITSPRDVEAAVAAFAPDVALLHSVGDAAVALRAARLVPTLSYEHDYRHICPGGGRFLRTPETFCAGGFGARCVVSPFTGACNSRRPDRLAASIGGVRAWRAVWPELAGVLCATGYVGELLAEHGVDRQRIDVVGYFARLPESEVPRVAAPRDILFAGRLTSPKGAHHLVAAFVQIAARFPESRLVLAGGAPEPGVLAAAARAGCADRIVVPGWLSGAALAALFAEAAVFVLPSLWPEPFGIAALDAQARGIPVVASAVGGLPEWIEHGVTGVLVPPGDPAALTEALAGILADPAAARLLGERGRERALGTHSLERHLERLVPCLERAAALGGRTGR